MHILVLDTIHGGKMISAAFTARGDSVDPVDVYRDESIIDIKTALTKTYDLVVAPVHLDPDHPLLQFSSSPVISHHEAVRQLLGNDLPEPMIEITGSRGKTTTAHALASLMPGKGILHTSTGTYHFPEKTLISRSSITPASVLSAAKMAKEEPGWLIAEVSLGVTGAGTLAIITSDEDYVFASGKKGALQAKVASAQHAKRLLLAKNIHADHPDGVVHVEDLAECDGIECRILLDNNSYRFSNPLLALRGYCEPLMLAGVAAAMLGLDPSPLSSFKALTGRMSVSYARGILVVDNANSGTCVSTIVEAAHYARNITGSNHLTLVIGQEEGKGAICEGFSPEQILDAIEKVRPDQVIWVGKFPESSSHEYHRAGQVVIARAATLDEGYSLAATKTEKGSIVLAVKTWR
jgi:UDP-N-acetylmuramyl pentapeptide synthase